MPVKKNILVVGVGNTYRSDDGIGVYIAGQLKNMLPEQVEVQFNHGDMISLIELWENYSCVCLIDAACSSHEPGRIYKFNLLNQKPPADIFSKASTHSLNIAEVILLAEILDRVPEKLIIYAVEGKDFEIGTDLSPELQQKVTSLAKFIKKDIDKILIGRLQSGQN